MEGGEGEGREGRNRAKPGNQLVFHKHAELIQKWYLIFYI